MKSLMQKSLTMKATNQPNFYFSAYPLKALSQTETVKEPYLRIITNPQGKKKKYAEGLKVLPMVNPYSPKEEARLSEKLNQSVQTDKVEERDSDWFASYE
jgi:hypothetical protein